MDKPKVLLWDIETAAFSNYRGPAADWGHVLCIGYKWLGEKTTYHLKLSDYPGFDKDPHDDKAMIRHFRQQLNEADILVAHYGDKFDKPFINTRLVYHNLGPMPPLRQIDTCLLAKKHFKFSSNRLKSIAQFLQLPEQKGKNNWPGDWFKAINGERKALDRLAKYCEQDVRTLESVYYALLPYIDAVSLPRTKGKCPKCSSLSLTKRGFTYTLSKDYQRLQCQTCGSWTKELLPKEK